MRREQQQAWATMTGRSGWRATETPQACEPAHPADRNARGFR